MKKRAKKLVLAKETLRDLELRRISGGESHDDTQCLGCTNSCIAYFCVPTSQDHTAAGC